MCLIQGTHLQRQSMCWNALHILAQLARGVSQFAIHVTCTSSRLLEAGQRMRQHHRAPRRNRVCRELEHVCDQQALYALSGCARRFGGREPASFSAVNAFGKAFESLLINHAWRITMRACLAVRKIECRVHFLVSTR
jgi:hypothetical protein